MGVAGGIIADAVDSNFLLLIAYNLKEQRISSVLKLFEQVMVMVNHPNVAPILR